MSTFFRRDDWVQNSLGNAIAGASVAFCSQPATTSTQPPSPLIQLYADSAGVTPISNPVITDGYGHSWAYMAQGTYTVVTYGAGIQTVVLTDQVISSPIPPATTWHSDSSTAATITGAIDSVNTRYLLSGSPNPAASLTFVVNGLVQGGVIVSGNSATLAVAPHTGAVLTSVYQVSS